MTEPTIITIGSADKGGWWYATYHATEPAFADGFRTEAEAEVAAIAATPTPWEIWYEGLDAGTGRIVSVPGAKSADHPDNLEVL
jgi:hypothetical protein